MSTTNLQLPDIAVGQSQKETTANSAHAKIDLALCGKATILVTTTNVSLTDSQHNETFYFEFTGAMTGARDVIFKGRNRPAMVYHNCTGAQNITLKAGSGAGANVVLSPGDLKVIYVDGAANAVVKPN